MIEVEEIDEDKNEDDSDFNGSFGETASNQVIINFETINEQVRKFEPDYEDRNDFISSYKNNISYFKFSTESQEVICLESYLILTKKYLFVFDLSNEEYPMVHENPIKVEEIQAIQMTFNNTLAGVFRIKGRTDVKFVVFEDETLE